MVEWHHRLNRHKFKRVSSRVGDGKGGLAGGGPRGLKESDTTERLN